YSDFDRIHPAAREFLREQLKKYQADNPEVTIAIPAYNEEKNIAKTLASFARMNPKYRTELLVINNNSKDRTKEIINSLGVKVIDEPRQSISFARQAGLENAKGKYFLNADADSVYPDGWIDAYVEALSNPQVTCVYGTYSFIPSKDSSRFVLATYEAITRLMFLLRRKKMDFFNVLGFNFAFRRDDGLRAGGFNTTRQRWSDGWMAMTLQQLGRIERITDERARVWTSDRRLVYDGGLLKAVWKRVTKEADRYTNLPRPEAEIKNLKTNS
ncbi:MAG TPA: glycosyltransferase, partial [Chitinophagales bacterium]|nr:glycosyltransferase [Chitinophagales bacterium]